jgi:hypothetical protein
LKESVDERSRTGQDRMGREGKGRKGNGEGRDVKRREQQQ